MEATHIASSDSSDNMKIHRVSEIIGQVARLPVTLDMLKSRNPDLRPFTLAEYVAAVRAQIQPAMPDAGLEYLLERYLYDNGNFDADFIPGELVAVFPTPCDENGDFYNARALDQFEHLHLFFADPKTGMRMKGWPGTSSPLFLFLPPEIQREMAFRVPDAVSRDEIEALMTRVYRRGQFYFDQAGTQELKQ
jgi:hypothetical protein